MAAVDNVYIAIHLVLAKRLMVTHFDMDLNPTVPVRVLKDELVVQLRMPSAQQQWFYRNTLIHDDYSLERMGVVNDSIIEVRPAPPPSSQSAGATASATVSAPSQTARTTPAGQLKELRPL